VLKYFNPLRGNMHPLNYFTLSNARLFYSVLCHTILLIKGRVLALDGLIMNVNCTLFILNMFSNCHVIVSPEQYVLKHGYPAYITSVGWLGYNQDKIRNLCQKALAEGWTRYWYIMYTT
jgi:hypothetical protein